MRACVRACFGVAHAPWHQEMRSLERELAKEAGQVSHHHPLL